MGDPPAKPEGDDNQNSNMSETPTKPDENNTDSISIIYYVIFGVESLVLTILVMYLIMSNFNKKTFKETFDNKDKIIIIILSVIILTTVLTCLDVYLANQTTSDDENVQGPGGGMNQNNSSIEYSAQKEITTAEANISGISVTKTGDSDGGDSTSFYGTNSAIIAKGGANLTLKNITVTTDATGANGVFCYGGSATTNNSLSDGTTVTISDSKITTTKDNSGGIMTTGGGIMNASNLENNTIVNNDTTGNFLRAKTDSWGKSGSNGGNVTLNMTNQKAIGNIFIDSVSTLVMNMQSNSYYEGAINTDNSAKSITLTLDNTSTIKLTADTYVTSLENADTTNSNIDFNGYKLYVNGTAIN